MKLKQRLKWSWAKKEEQENNSALPLASGQSIGTLQSTKRILKYWKKQKFQTLINPPTEEHKGRLRVAVNGKDGNTGHFVRVLTLKDYPPSILVGYLDRLEEIVNGQGASLRKTIRYAESKVKWNNRLRYKLRRLNRNIHQQQKSDDPARKAEIQAKETIEAIRDSTSQHNSKLVEVTTFLTISAEKKFMLDNAEADLKMWFDKMDGELDNLRREQPEALRQSGIGHDDNNKRSEFFNKRHYGRVLTDEIAAGTYPMTRGSFSDGEGLYFGRRSEDGSFCFLNICDPNNSDAQNMMVFGKTGSGKSFFLKALVVSLLQENVHVFVFDLDGEWKALCEKVGGIYIDQTTGEGNYFEPMVIMPWLPGVDEDIVAHNRKGYENAESMTIRTFSLLMGNKMESEHENEIGNAITEVYQRAGIYENDPLTWHQECDSEVRPTLYKVFDEIKTKAFDDEYHSQQDAFFVYQKTKLYFEGVHRRMFQKEEQINFEGAPLVVFKVGEGILESDSGEVKSQKAQQSELKMSMALDIVNAQIARLKVEGAHFSAVLIDEGQRQLQNAKLRDAIFSWYTAIRKLNGMMILASNSPAVILQYSNGVAMYENTDVKVFFYMDDSAVRALATQASITLEVQESILASDKTRMFMLEYNLRYDQLFMDVPEAEAELYKTRGLKKAG